FYEINPRVAELARSEFTFLSDTAAYVEVLLGDARLTLAREPSQGFDVLALDAFSGDAIPVHLLTKEAFALYFRHLKVDGILAVHVSNQYLDLSPVVDQLARFYGRSVGLIQSERDDERGLSSATWVLVAQDRIGKPIPPRPHLRMWTDDYNNLLQ